MIPRKMAAPIILLLVASIAGICMIIFGERNGLGIAAIIIGAITLKVVMDKTE